MTDWRHDLMRRYPQLFAAGGVPTVGDGWYLTRCAGHARGEPMPIKSGWEDLHVVETISGGKFRIVSCRRYDRERDALVDVPLPAGREGDSK